MSEVKHLEPHQQRVVDEHAELRDRRNKLLTFIRSGAIFTSLPHDERRDLVDQADAMMYYMFILSRRIQRFTAQ